MELQKFAANYLKISSEKTMKIAEKLYNDGYISYPRTETDVFDLGFDHRALLQIQSSHPVWGSYVKGYTIDMTS